MKKILFAAGITIIGLSAAFAQEVKQAAPAKTEQSGSFSRVRNAGRNVDPAAAAQRRTDRLDKELTLNDEQKKKVYELFLQESKDNQGRLAQTNHVDDQLKTILNEEQNKKYEAIKAERKQMMMQRMQNPRATETKSPSPVK